MRDVQHRLLALGLAAGDDETGDYGPGTVAAVRAFQDRRGLRIDGVCGDDTWSALVEAGYRLGDRHLSLSAPYLRGDDVAALQRRLGSLGFDPGRVDGIFGKSTDRALVDFQRNVGLVTDAICGPSTLAALGRLGASGSTPSVTTVRERERHFRRPHSLAGRSIAIGDTGGLDAVASLVAAALTEAGGKVLLLQHPDGSEQAAHANAVEVDAYLGLSLADGPNGCSTAYYRAASGWESPEGRRLAELVQNGLVPVLHGRNAGVRGMAVPVLRETRMPAVVAELGAAGVVVERAADVATALTAALRRWVAPAADA